MITCYIGLGSNLGNRQKNIGEALRLINEIPGARLDKVSSFYETEAQGCPLNSQRFINSAARLQVSLTPSQLLKRFQGIEINLGRERRRLRNSPRRIDIDILFYGDKIINTPKLKIPHPRLRERSFTLNPLKEIAPRLIKSIAGETLLLSNIPRMRAFTDEAKKKGKTIGFVPTMGYLHPGHLSLIRQAKNDCDICVASIFVNPIQFGPKEDYRGYPRDMEMDRILSRSAGADCVFSPSAVQMYPPDYQTYVNVEKISSGLCGSSRPGHFQGVATVVNKLFNIVQPDIAYFGEKDYQQALVIKRMVSDLNMPLKIKVMPIIREADGLAMSSRNRYLNHSEKQEAIILYQSLQRAREMISGKERDSQKIIKEIKRMILKEKTAKIDYAVVVNAQTLQPLNLIKGKTLIALAAWIGKTRLIDNTIVNFN